MYYTYVLQSIKDKGLYAGFTKNLKLRFEQHNKGRVESTKDRTPVKLIYYEACLDQDDATKREKYLKTYNGTRYLAKRLKSYLTGVNPVQKNSGALGAPESPERSRRGAPQCGTGAREAKKFSHLDSLARITTLCSGMVSGINQKGASSL
jgi:putative endonuclease